MSIQEEATLASQGPMIAMFNKLVMFDAEDRSALRAAIAPSRVHGVEPAVDHLRRHGLAALQRAQKRALKAQALGTRRQVRCDAGLSSPLFRLSAGLPAACRRDRRGARVTPPLPFSSSRGRAELGRWDRAVLDCPIDIPGQVPRHLVVFPRGTSVVGTHRLCRPVDMHFRY